MFVLRSTAARAAAALVVSFAVGLPLFLVSRPEDLRPGPLLILGAIVVAAVAGWWAAGLTGGLLLAAYWFRALPPTNSFRLADAEDLVGLVGMAAAVLGLAVLTKRVERAVEDVRGLDGRRQEHAQEEGVLRSRAEQAAEEVRAVLEISTAMAEVSSMADVAQVALDGIHLPMPPDNGSIAVLEGNHLKVLASRDAIPASIKALERIDITTSSWLGDVLDGKPALVDDREEFAAAHPNARTLAIYPSGSWAVVPFRSESTVGLLSVHYPEPQPVKGHATYFSLLSEILATALDRARAEERQRLDNEALAQAFSERDRVARTLSRMLLPAKLPALPGISAAAWLTPASADEVSGDFYDVFPVGDGDWVAVLGDVCGKGAEAAAVTSLARYAARVTALDSPDPMHIAAVANQALIEDPSDLFCTMAVIHFSRSAEVIDVTLAGHPQPRLISGGTVRRVGRFARPLGLAEYPTQVEQHAFRPGDLLVLFSDGLIERSPDFGEDQLDEALASWSDLGASAITAALHDLVGGLAAERTDDLAVLVIGRDREE
jgi:serine phosphatase RsbU (regulator of sigma subunit)